MTSTELIAQAVKRYNDVDLAPIYNCPLGTSKGLWTNGYIQGWLENLKHEGKHVAGQVLEDILAERDALQAENKRLAWFVMMHKPKYGYNLDHACAECVPGGEMVQQGWRCGFHLAAALSPAEGKEEK